MKIFHGTIDEMIKNTSNNKPVTDKVQDPEPMGLVLFDKAHSHEKTIHFTTMPKKTTHTTCYCCKSTDFWQSAMTENHFVCRKCHPPAPGAEMIKDR